MGPLLHSAATVAVPYILPFSIMLLIRAVRWIIRERPTAICLFQAPVNAMCARLYVCEFANRLINLANISSQFLACALSSFPRGLNRYPPGADTCVKVQKSLKLKKSRVFQQQISVELNTHDFSIFHNLNMNMYVHIHTYVLNIYRKFYTRIKLNIAIFISFLILFSL